MTPREVLIAARALIATPDTWTQGYAARDASGAPVTATWSRATSFCMYGAVLKITECQDHNKRRTVLNLLYAECQQGLNSRFVNITGFNDTYGRTHADVLKVFDEAIARSI